MKHYALRTVMRECSWAFSDIPSPFHEHWLSHAYEPARSSLPCCSAGTVRFIQIHGQVRYIEDSVITPHTDAGFVTAWSSFHA